MLDFFGNCKRCRLPAPVRRRCLTRQRRRQLLFINLSAMWVALLSPKLLGESFSRKKIVGVLFGLMGVVFVSTNLDFSTLGQGQLAGDLLLIVSGFTWALFMIYNKKLVMNSTLGNFSIYDLGAYLNISIHCAVYGFVGTGLF